MRKPTAIAVATVSSSTAEIATASAASRVPRPLGTMKVSTATQKATGYAAATYGKSDAGSGVRALVKAYTPTPITAQQPMYMSENLRT